MGWGKTRRSRQRVTYHHDPLVGEGEVYNIDKDQYYGSIQAAVDDADDGDGLLVGPGTYEEQVLVDVDDLTIRSYAGPGQTTIDVGYEEEVAIRVIEGPPVAAGFYVDVDRVHIEGFTIVNAEHGIYVEEVHSGAVTIRDNVILGSSCHGIRVHTAGTGAIDSITIEDNEVRDAGCMGIRVFACDESTVGVVTVEGNTVRDSGSMGIRVHAANESTIVFIEVHDNTSTGNETVGIRVHAGDQGRIDSVEVTENTVNENGRRGIRVHAGYLTSIGTVLVEGNVVLDNGWETENGNEVGPAGIVECPTVGIRVHSGRFSTIESVTVRGNEVAGSDIGVRVSACTDGEIETAVVEDNVITDNLTGLLIYAGEHHRGDWGAGGTLADVFVSGNEITQNGIGVNVAQGAIDGSVTGVVVTENLVFENSEYGLVNDTGTDVDATGNWWGDATGPYHATDNDEGEGDWVSDDVLFDPWYIDEDLENLSDEL